MPALLAEEKTPALETSHIFKKYQFLSSDSYTWRSFKGVFVKWVKENVIPTPQKLIDLPNKPRVKNSGLSYLLPGSSSGNSYTAKQVYDEYFSW
jgi:hypothetical protein